MFYNNEQKENPNGYQGDNQNENLNEYQDENMNSNSSDNQTENQSDGTNGYGSGGSNSYQSTESNGYQNDEFNHYQNSYYNNNQNYEGGGYGNNQQKPSKKNKKTIIVAVIIAAVVFLAASLAVTIGIVSSNLDSSDLNNMISQNSESNGTQYEDIGSTSLEEGTDDSSSDATTLSSSGVMVTDVSNVVDATMPSIVAITSTTLVENAYDYYDDVFNYYFGGGSRGNEDQTYEEQAAGSGIIVDQTDTELLIVTNNHVVEGADSLEIQFNGQDENETIQGYIKGTDADADVAVVAVELEDIPSDVLNNIKKATLGDSDTVKVGEGVIAIGNALGYGQSVTTGIISAKDREATIEDKTMKLLQTDAAINGGNSGGALINSKGEVIGINVAKYSSSGYDNSASIEGMGFAIPISSVKSIISNLETKETRTKVSDEEKGYLGISGYDVTESVSEQYSMPEGVYVYSVTENGPADKAGIENSDVITKFDGQTVSSMSSLQSMLDYYKSGEEVTLTIAYRDGREYVEKEVTVTLGDSSVIENMDE